VVSAARWVPVAAWSVAGCASIWGFEDLRSGDGGTGGTGALTPGLTGGRSAGGQPSNAGATGTGGAVLACQRNCVAPCTDCAASYCTDLDSDPKNCGACGTACQGGRVCAGGKCECAPDFELCQGNDLVDACFDLASDAKHCGKCETACELDGLCESGTCQYPEELAIDQGNPRAIAVDASHVYYSTGTEIRRVPVDGPKVPETLTTAGVVDDLVLYGDSLFFVDTTANKLLRLPLDGGEPIDLAEVVAPAPLSAYEEQIYFLQGSTVYAVPAEGGERLTIASQAAEDKVGLVVNDEGIYVTWGRTFRLYDHLGTASALFATRSESTQVSKFVVYGDAIYYTYSHVLSRITAGATYGNSLGTDYVTGFAIDRDEIVIAGSGGIRVRPTSDAGSAARVISADNPVNIAVRGDYVYWTRGWTAVDANDGKIRRIHR
jgi:hypothetical protein